MSDKVLNANGNKMITVILDGVEKHSQGIMGGMLCADSPRGVSLCASTEGLIRMWDETSCSASRLEAESN